MSDGKNTDIDPTIAALLESIPTDETSDSEDIDVSSFDSKSNSSSGLSFSFNNKTTDKSSSAPTSGQKSIHTVDLSQKEFPPIEKILNDEPSKVFDDPNYYKSALTNENQSAQRIHQVLSKYLTCQDPKDRTVYRQNIISAYWELFRGLAPKLADINLPMPKRMLARFGVLLPSLFRPEQKLYFSKVIFENSKNLPIMYVDEWFKEIASGRMNNSMTDEKRTPHKAATPEEASRQEQSRLQQLQSKNSGKLQSAENLLNIKENERKMLELELKDTVEALCEHNPIPGAEPHLSDYSETQVRMISQITDKLHRLSKNNKELSRALADFQDAKGIYENVENKLTETDSSASTVADTDAAVYKRIFPLY